MRASALRRRDVQRREDDPPGVGVDPGQEARVGPFARSPDQGIDPNVEHLAGRQLDRARQTADEGAIGGAQFALAGESEAIADRQRGDRLMDRRRCAETTGKADVDFAQTERQVAQREVRRPLDGRRQGVAPDDSGGERRRERVAVAVGRAERQRLPRARLMAT